MDKYLKMADVFEGEVKAKHIDEEAIDQIMHGEDSGKDWTIEDSRYWMAMQYEHASYAAHAINSHDELVQMNQELLAALEIIAASEEFHGDSFVCDFGTLQGVARAAIAKAKGGAAK